MDSSNSFDEEAIPERDPNYDPKRSDDDTTCQAFLTESEMIVWNWMRRIRPMLNAFGDANAVRQ